MITDNMKTVPEYPNYRATKDGKIWSNKQAKFLKPAKINGRLAVKLSKKTLYIHRLVLQAFVGPCPFGAAAKHLDEDNMNNRLENLAWRGEKHQLKGLSAADEKEIIRLRKKYPRNWPISELMRVFSATRGQIKDILRE